MTSMGRSFTVAIVVAVTVCTSSVHIAAAAFDREASSAEQGSANQEGDDFVRHRSHGPRRAHTKIDSSCRPPRDQTYLTIGQDLLSVADYLLVQYNASLHESIRADASVGASPASHHRHAINPTLESSKKTLLLPAAFMVYTDIQQLRGLFEPVDYGSGIEYADGFWDIVSTTVPLLSMSSTIASSPTSISLQIGLWLNGTAGCRDLVEGRLQAQVQRLFHYCINHVPAQSSKIFLRVGYEFDNPAFGYYDDSVVNNDNLTSSSSDDATSHDHSKRRKQQTFSHSHSHVYAQAFRYLVDACVDYSSHETCHDKIAFVWHSWAVTYYNPTSATASTSTSTTASSTADTIASTTAILSTVPTLDDFYPGDDYVDWIGISLFSQLYPPIVPDNTTTTSTVPNDIPRLGSMQTVQTVLDYAVRRDKPVMIAESSPFGGIDILTDPWTDWFDQVLQLIDDYGDTIGMWSYIHCNWNAQPMWHDVGFGDSRLSTNATVLQLWRQEVLSSPRFTSQLSCRTEQAPSPPPPSAPIHDSFDVHRHGDDDGDDDVVNLDAIEANLASWRLENVEPDSNRRYFAIASYWIVGAIATVWGLLLVGQVVGVNDWLKQRQRSSSSTARPTWDNEECQALKESSDPDAGDPQRQRQTRGSFNYGSILE